MVQIIQEIPAGAKAIVHSTAISGVVANLLGILPAILTIVSALLSSIWFALNIYVFYKKHFRKEK